MVQGKTVGLRSLILVVLIAAATAHAESDAQEQAFVTWNIFEPDKCASIWLIKRFIAPDAVILFYGRDEEPPPGIPFDTPEARFRRYHNRSTYETLLEHYRLEDEALKHIGRIIHDIEVNLWERKVLEQTRRIESEVFRILSDERPQATVKACLGYFDALYSSAR